VVRLPDDTGLGPSTPLEADEVVRERSVHHVGRAGASNGLDEVHEAAAAWDGERGAEPPPDSLKRSMGVPTRGGLTPFFAGGWPAERTHPISSPSICLVFCFSLPAQLHLARPDQVGREPRRIGPALTRVAARDKPKTIPDKATAITGQDSRRATDMWSSPEKKPPRGASRLSSA